MWRLGSVLANALVRGGVGHLRLVDRDFIETSNLHRQVLFDERDIADNLPKAEAAARKLAAINSSVRIEPVVTHIDRTNILELVRDADLILDGTDNFEIRYLINDAAVKLGKPWVYGGCIGSHGQTMTILPGETPCLHLRLRRSSGSGRNRHLRNSRRVAPSSTLSPATRPQKRSRSSLAGARTSTAISFTSMSGKMSSAASRWHRSWARSIVLAASAAASNGWTACTALILPACAAAMPSSTHRSSTTLQFETLARQLEHLGEVHYNRFLLRFNAEGHEFTVFPDGRAIIKGTGDTDKARTLYAKYVGH